ncbi:hypothetical protein ABZ990_13055 [Streptomyces sp. NPDC046203]|uniref:hypothetical protein n=1 Tax=Streptomyces sp. NPDC046203 TaxID=3154602 RepID=UPI0033D13C74
MKDENRKWIPLGAVLGIAAGGVLLAALPPSFAHREVRPPQVICFGALTTKTAALLGDPSGGGGAGSGMVTAGQWERRGKGDYAFFQSCQIERAASAGAPRVVSGLMVQDTKAAAIRTKDTVPVGGGITGWIRPDQAEAALPDGCVAAMGSTAPYIVVSVSARSQEKKEKLVEPEIAIRNNRAALREAVTRLAELYGCKA